MASQYMLDHKDDFIAFLPSVGGEDTAEATSDGMMTDKGFQKYCRLVAETGEWGGEPEVRPCHSSPTSASDSGLVRGGQDADCTPLQIQALSRAFRIPIHVIQSGPPTIVSHGGTDDQFGGAMTPQQSLAQGEKVVRISYHRRMYGLGEVSLMLTPSRNNGPLTLRPQHYNSLRRA